MAQLGSYTNIKIEEGLIRHMVLNSIRSYNTKFSKEYGEMVIACDDRNYWRRDIFPYYKAHRKKAREESEIDWTTVFESLNKIRDELIGTLVHKYGKQLTSKSDEKILILSGDKDFIQLQTYSNVEQFDPVRKKYIKNKEPEKFIREHIIRGDKGDGIPNFLSADNCIIVGERQKSVSSKKLELWLNQEPEEFCDENMLRNYHRNRQLIDLTFIPQYVRDNVMAEYEAQANKSRQHIFNYFIKFKLKGLMESINDF
jgi:5'-3' exonuclease